MIFFNPPIGTDFFYCYDRVRVRPVGKEINFWRVENFFASRNTRAMMDRIRYVRSYHLIIESEFV